MTTRLCAQCGNPVLPGAVFCGKCGHGSHTGSGMGAMAATAYVPATHAQVRAALPHKTAGLAIWVILGGGVVAAMVLLALVAYLYRPQVTHCVPPRCGTAPPLRAVSPPLAPPVAYVSPTFGYSVEYPAYFTPAQTTDSAIAWSGSYDQGPAQWSFIGDKAGGRGPQQVANDFQQSRFPSAKFVYPLPDPNLGFNPGYGAVYDVFATSAGGQAAHQRLIIISAIKNDVAVTFFGTGPFVQTSDKADGHPNPAQTPMVHEMLFGQAIESVIWKGDPPL